MATATLIGPMDLTGLGRIGGRDSLIGSTQGRGAMADRTGGGHRVEVVTMEMGIKVRGMTGEASSAGPAVKRRITDILNGAVR